MSNKLGPCYFGHPTRKDAEGRKETVYLGTVFENKFDPNDPRKDLSLSFKAGEKWLRASEITYGRGDDAVTVEIPEGAFIKIKVNSGGAASGGQPGRF